jgi:hypothetical protein
MIPGPGACLQKLKGKLPIIYHNMICKYIILINNEIKLKANFYRETGNMYMPWTMTRKFAYVEYSYKQNPLRKNLVYDLHVRQSVRIINQSLK